jgi:hypothetical protein
VKTKTNGDMLNVIQPQDISMRESLSWLGKYNEPQTDVVTFDPSLPTNTVLLSVLERYSDVEGFTNTLARVLLAEQKRDNT